MLYKAMYLPVNKPLRDGCKIINREGEVFTYDEKDSIGWSLPGIQVAELFLVKEEYNQRVVVGHVNKHALKWVKPGMEFRSHDCIDQETSNTIPNLPILSVICPTCRTIH